MALIVVLLHLLFARHMMGMTTTSFTRMAHPYQIIYHTSFPLPPSLPHSLQLKPHSGHIALHPPSPLHSSFFHIFGGINTTSNTLPSSFLSDTFRFDLPPVEAWTEEDLPLPPSVPGPRAYAGVGHGERHTLVVGGFAGFTGDTDDRLLNDVWVFRHGKAEKEGGREGGREGGSEEVVRQDRRQHLR